MPSSEWNPSIERVESGPKIGPATGVMFGIRIIMALTPVVELIFGPLMSDVFY